MKGIVFSEFIEMVENKFSPEVADRIIEDSELASGGAYTAVGSYDHGELVKLVIRLGEETGIKVPDLVQAFGRHLFGRFVMLIPQFFEHTNSTFDFLKTVVKYIHVEVRKLYPEAELPQISCEEAGDDRLKLLYKSSRPFGDLAEGLIQGCAEHYGDSIHIEREDLSSNGQSCILFQLSAR